MDVTKEVMALAQDAALKHLGYDSMEDAHYWAKDDYDLNRLDALIAIIGETISAALTTAQSEAADLRKEVERYRQALISVSRWIASWRQIDLAQECADGGVMSYHVVQQEAAQQMERISAALKETQHEG